jgi:peroxiredoxin
MFGQHGAGLVGKKMPKLDQLHRTRQQQGFVVFGLSEEEVSLQRKFAEQVPVSYPLLTLKGELRSIYRDIARYPAIFLIDRRGQLQPAPGPDQPFENVAAAVDVSSTVLASVPGWSTLLGA